MKQTIRRILEYVGEYKKLIFFSAFSALISVTGMLFAPLIIGRAIDDMAAGNGAKEVFYSLCLLLAVYLCNSFFLWLLNYLTNRISYYTVNRLRESLFDKLSVLPLKFYDQNAHGDTISRFINDADTVSDGLLQGFMALLQGIVTILGSIVFMLYLNPAMTVIVVLSAPASFFTARFITNRSQNLFREQAKYLGDLNGYAEEMIEGQKIVKAFLYDKRAIEQFRKINAGLYEAGVKSQFISSLSNPSTRVINNLAYTVVGVCGSIAAIYGHLTAGGISSFLIFTVIFAKPFNDITNVLTQMQSAVASAQRIFHILDLPPEPPSAPNAVSLESCGGHVEFEHVSFAYQPGQHLIEDFNLDVKPGSSIAIVGKTGAGKTTLVNLLMRFYDVDKGSIRIDGTDIRNLTRSSLRARFGMVLQDTWLFDGTIRDNIAYAKPNASMQEIVAAAKEAGADSFIRKLEKGYDTEISADGENISEGQKQLLTIARVMLANPPMLILDEATSNIDTYTEMKIQKAFTRLTAGRTSFVIAHRLSTIRNAALILVMHQGRIVESGTHEELLKKKGYYADLYCSQFSS
ncbi:ABC transporter ATP-binding protein [Caproiciproducens galactitolivorans]|uniref:Putative ABC transporter ATP-binding protein n=1 Tax=Caproiciproducens galactitolivorans TaxID=642589 RepID=A0A4Z0Y4G1_9FIRM|nr:ABC transporter ATP-binding protein [Caproiciproducens galactitolivorans]QEY34455.1 ABC transporter ATP-binding protein [Caproiciproducens galactitolivorans]TGJ77767.1 putative ABC transporter ATP-binding protein [Caproiciproducens galactitolivorans]